jgi:hypothetical protein
VWRHAVGETKAIDIARQMRDAVMISLRRYLESNRGNYFLNQIRTDSGSRPDWARAIHLEVTRYGGEARRLPRTLYSKLTKQAENEGVSINSLVTAIIAEAIGAKQAR